jgi:hypothetical protein
MNRDELAKQLPAEIAAPAHLRDATLRAVARRRTLRRWQRIGSSAAGIAALAFVVLMIRPREKQGAPAIHAGKDLVARARAQPDFAEIDAAEQDIEAALKSQPGDADLAIALTRVRRQRDALQQLVTRVDQ